MTNRITVAKKDVKKFKKILKDFTIWMDEHRSINQYKNVQDKEYEI